MDFICENPCPSCPPAPAGTRGLSPNDPNNPFLNLSSEAPDVDQFIGRYYTNDDPPLGSFYYAVGCLGFCVGNSQSEADLCAVRQNVLCNSNNWPIPGGGGTPPPTPGPAPNYSRPVYANTPQTCTKSCPDGTTNSYTVPAGTFFAFNQATANAQAHSYACNVAIGRIVCLSNLSKSRVCLNEFSTLVILASGISLGGEFIVVGEGLPPGMELVQVGQATAHITGLPVTPGDYTFVIAIFDDFGNYGEKTYTVGVFGIPSQAIPEATTGSPYSYQITYAGTAVGIPTYQLVGGALPDGLTLSTSGLISGTPTGSGGSTFDIQIDDDNVHCITTLFMEVISGCFTNSSTLPNGQFRSFYGVTFIPNAAPDPFDPFFFTIEPGGTGLPAGMSLDAITGELTGTPTEYGDFSFVVKVETIAFWCQQTFYLHLIPGIILENTVCGSSIISGTATGTCLPGSNDLGMISSATAGAGSSSNGKISATLHVDECLATNLYTTPTGGGHTTGDPALLQIAYVTVTSSIHGVLVSWTDDGFTPPPNTFSVPAGNNFDLTFESQSIVDSDIGTISCFIASTWHYGVY